MHRGLVATIKILLILITFSACSKTENLSTPEKVYVSVVFTPEGFCNMGYNDISLKAIESLSNKYGFDYSFSVPETLEDGLDYYNAWCNAEIDENTRCLFIFTSGVYESYLADAPRPSADSRKDVLIFEVEKGLPYAYTFSMSYYGAAYMIGSYYLSRFPIDFQIVAANPHLSGLNYVVDGFTAATEDLSLGTVNLSYISEQPGGGLDDDDLAFATCKLAHYFNSENNNIFIPYAGLSDLGVYRFAESNHQVAVGIDCIDPDSFTQTLLCMNKRLDLALDDFLSLWTKGETPPRYRFYTLESGKVVVDRSFALSPYSKQLDEQLEQAIAKENEYFSRREVNE